LPERPGRRARRSARRRRRDPGIGPGGARKRLPAVLHDDVRSDHLLGRRGRKPGGADCRAPGGQRGLLGMGLQAVPGRPPVSASEILAAARRGRPPEESVKPFRVVVAGRPNVGKSALVNRLLRRRRGLGHDLPRLTPDAIEGGAALPDGRTYRLLDTGGYDPEGKEKIPAAVRD